MALESLGHCEYAMKAGFHLNPKAIEASLQVGSAKPALSSLCTLKITIKKKKKRIGLMRMFSLSSFPSNLFLYASGLLQ